MRLLAVICGAMAAVLWVLFSKMNFNAHLCPSLLTPARDGLGMVFFSAAAAVALTVSIAVTVSAIHSGSWGSEGKIAFWGGVSLSFVFLVSGLQFLLVSRWEVVPPLLYVIVKMLLFIAVIGYLVGSLISNRRRRKEPSSEKKTS